MRMVSNLYTFQIVVVVSMVWRPSHAVIELLCRSNIILNPSSATTYRFGDYITPYATGLSCNFDFSLSDANEKIIFQIFPQCTSNADVLKINNGRNECCLGCDVSTTDPTNALQVSLTTDSTSGPEEFGFVIRIATGKDKSNCTTSNPSPIIVSVASSPVIITSPGFPNKYPSPSDCRYTISPHDSSKGLSLTFDVISLDYSVNSNECYDKIQLGLYNTDPVKICTNYTMHLFLPNERYTSGGETHLNFSSDVRDEGYGFRVTIIQVDLGATQPPTAASTTAVQTVETTTSETTAAPTTAVQTTETTSASTTSAQTTRTTLESTTAAQTTKTTAASATVGTTTETTVKSTTSQTTAVSATVQSVSSTITASTAESTAAPHTNPTTETIESNETTQDLTTTTSSTSMTTVTKPEVTVSSTELPPTTSFPETTTTGFFDALTTSAKVVAVTGLVFLGVVPLIVIAVFCLMRKRKKSSRDNRSHNPNLHNAKYNNTYHYQRTHKPLFYQYWG